MSPHPLIIVCLCPCVWEGVSNKICASSICSFESDLLPKFLHRKFLLGSTQVSQLPMLLSVPIWTISDEHMHFSVCYPLSPHPPVLAVITAIVHRILKVAWACQSVVSKTTMKLLEPSVTENCVWALDETLLLELQYENAIQGALLHEKHHSVLGCYREWR